MSEKWAASLKLIEAAQTASDEAYELKVTLGGGSGKEENEQTHRGVCLPSETERERERDNNNSK